MACVELIEKARADLKTAKLLSRHNDQGGANQQSRQRGGAVPDPFWVGSK